MDKQIWMGKFLILSFIIPLAIYFRTLLPTVGFWDTAEFQTIPYTFDVGHPTGYPTYIVIGKIFLTLFNFNSVAWRMNFLSAIFVSFGIYILSLSLLKLTEKPLLALSLGVLLSVNPYLWSVAIRADPHALHFLFNSILIFLGIKILKEKKNNLLPLIAFICGISLGNHMLSLFFLPSLIFLGLTMVRAKNYSKTVLLSLLTFILGISIYLVLPILSITKIPMLNIDYSLATLDGFKRHVLGQDFQGLMNTWARENLAGTLLFYFNLLQKSFPYYLWILIPIGFLVNFIKFPKITIFLSFIFLPTLIFSMRYQNAVIERYFLTTFAIELIWVGVFIDKLIKNRILYVAIVTVLLLLSASNFVSNFKSIDQSKNFYGYSWASKALESVDQNGVVFSWWSYSTPLWYLQKVEGVRDDVLIINAGKHEWETLAKELIDDRPIYFIESVSLSNPEFKLIKEVELYRMVSTHF